MLQFLAMQFCDTNLLPGDSKGFFPDDPGHSFCTRWRGEWAIICQVEVRELRHQPGQWERLQEHHSAVGHPNSLQQLHYLLKTHVVMFCFRDLKNITPPFQFLCVYTTSYLPHHNNISIYPTHLYFSLSRCILLTLPTFCACVYIMFHSTTAELQVAWITESFSLSDYCCSTPSLSAVNQPKSHVAGKGYHCQHSCGQNG